MASKAEVIDYIVDKVDSILPGDKSNGVQLRKDLEAMSEADFKAFVTGLRPRASLEPGEQATAIPFYLPNLTKRKISIRRMYELCRKLGYPIAQRLVLTDPATKVRYVTPHEYPIFHVMVRRQAQTAFKKRSIPGVKQQIDELSGQPTATAKGSRISGAERRYLQSRGLVQSQNELSHVRGGATLAYREFRNALIQDGTVDLTMLEGLGPATSTQTASALLNACHIGNNYLAETPVPDDALPKDKR